MNSSVWRDKLKPLGDNAWLSANRGCFGGPERLLLGKDIESIKTAWLAIVAAGLQPSRAPAMQPRAGSLFLKSPCTGETGAFCSKRRKRCKVARFNKKCGL